MRRGAQNFAVICVYPSDHPITRWSIAEHEAIMKTINQFWINTSYNQISINYLVKGWYNLGHNWSHYGSINADGSLQVNDWKTVVKDAIALADPVIDFNTYDYVIVWINTAWWRGWASIGKNININTAEGAKTIAATLCGENLGNSLEIGATILAGNQFKIFGKLNFLDCIPTNLIPENPLDKIIYLNIVNKDYSTVKYNATFVVDENGEFEGIITVKSGIYKINGYYSGLEYIASSATSTLMVDLENSSVWTSKPFPSFELIIVFGSLFVLASLSKTWIKRYKR